MKRILLVFSLFIPLSFYAQSDAIAVGKAAKIATVSADMMNVVYRGIPNPIAISLPNNISFMASAPGLSKDEKGKYTLTPESGTEVIVNVVYQKNGSYVSEKHKFKIVDIPPLNIVIGSNTSYSLCADCVYEVAKNELKEANLSVQTSRHFLYELPAKILGMGFTFPDGKYLRISGTKVNQEVFTEIGKLKKGDTFTIKFSVDGNSDLAVNLLKIMIKE